MPPAPYTTPTPGPQRLAMLRAARTTLASQILSDADHEQMKKLQATIADEARIGQQARLDAQIAEAEESAPKGEKR